MDFRVIEAAKILGVSKVTVYKKLEQHRERLSAHLSEHSGVTYISEEGVSELRLLLRSGAARLRPGEQIAAEELNRLIDHLSAVVSVKKEIIRQKTIQMAEYDSLIDKYTIGRRN